MNRRFLPLASVLALISISSSALHAKTREEVGRQDDPRARAEYLSRHHGGEGPLFARIHALNQRSAMMVKERAAQLAKQAAAKQGSGAGVTGQVTNQAASASQWIPIGPAPALEPAILGSTYPNSSGRVTAVAVDPTNANRIYIGAAAGGVWRSDNAGASWTPLSDSWASMAIGSLAVDSLGNVYVGTGEENYGVDNFYGAGVYLCPPPVGSVQSCTQVTNGFSFNDKTTGGFPSIGSMAVTPGTSGATAELLAGVNAGSADGPGVYHSTDGGNSWTRVLNATAGGFPSATSVAIAKDPTTHLVSYWAALYGTGVYKSSDGVNWTLSSSGITLTNAGRITVAVAPSNPSIAYALVAAESTGDQLGFFFTTNAGGSWTPMPFDSASNTNPTPGHMVDVCSPQCWYDQVVIVNPTDPNTVIVGGAAEFTYDSSHNAVDASIQLTHQGTNTAATWAGISPNIHVDEHAAAFATDGHTLYWGNDGGVYRTDTSVTPISWTSLNNNLQTTQFYTNFDIDPTNFNRTFAGAQDNGTQAYDGTQSISGAWQDVACGDGASAVIDVNTPSVVFTDCPPGTSNQEILESVSSGAAGSFNVSTNTTSSVDADAARTQFIPPMKGDGKSPMNVYYGTDHLWRGTQDSSHQLTWSELETADLDLNGATTGFGITNFSVSGDGNTVYTGSDVGTVWKGAGLNTSSPQFTQITPSNVVPANEIVNAVAVSPTNSNIVYLGYSGFESGQRIFEADTTTSPATFSNITSNLPTTEINDIVVDPVVPNTIYVATDIGVFVTSNGGVTWATAVTGLPNVPVMGIRLQAASRILRAVTHGRGAWDLFVPAPANITPASFDFSYQLVNTTASQTFIFADPSGSDLLNVAVSVSTGYQESNNCAATVTNGSSCTITVTFAPTAAGTFNGGLTVSWTGSSTTAALSGIAVTSFNPVPAISSVTPLQITAGSAGPQITVTGTNFVSSSVVNWGGSARPTTFVSSTSLTAQLTSADVASTGKGQVAVTNPVPGGGSSNTSTLSIDSSSSGAGNFAIAVSPSALSVTAGQSATATIAMSGNTGNFFYSCLDLPSGASCSVSGTTLTIATAASTPRGSYQVVVVASTTQLAGLEEPSGLALAFAIPVFIGWKRRSRLGAILGLTVLAIGLYAGCGGGGSSSSTSSTPVVVTAQGQHSTVVTLTVN